MGLAATAAAAAVAATAPSGSCSRRWRRSTACRRSPSYRRMGTARGPSCSTRRPRTSWPVDTIRRAEASWASSSARGRTDRRAARAAPRARASRRAGR
eukprot:4095762-Prymnesium_polylepis.1